MNALIHADPVSLWAAMFCALSCLAAAELLFRLRGPASSKDEDRMVCFDGLRGFSVLGVFFNHYVIAYYYGRTGVLMRPPTDFYNVFGQAGICFFFMMSGFLFWRKLWLSGGHVDWKRLFLMRVFRLTPLYWVYVALIMVIIFTTGGPSLKEPLSSVLYKIGQWLLFFWSPVINHFNNGERFPVRVQWTLRYEWIFYFSLPLLALAIRVSKKIPLVLWLIAAAVIFGAVNPVRFEAAGVQLNTRFFIYFLLGCLPASFDHEKIKLFARGKLISVLSLTAFAAYCAIFSSGYDIAAIPFLMLFFVPAAYGNSMFGLLKMRSAVVLGELSYSFYLLHALVLYVLFKVWFPSFFSWGTGMMWVNAGMAATAVAVVFLSHLTFTFIGKPFIALGRRLAGEKNPL